MDQLAGFGEETWFRLGDRDIALHIARTARIRAGGRLTEVCLGLQGSLGIAPRILPMTDDPVATEVRTADGWLEFQEYFVHRRQAPEVLEVRFTGIEDAAPTPEVRTGDRDRRRDRDRPVEPRRVGGADPRRARDARAAGHRPGHAGLRIAAVSPIIGGRALKGPADRMLASLGHEVSALGVARLYADLCDVFVLDAD